METLGAVDPGWRMSMGTENLRDDVLLVTLPRQPQASSDIEQATRMITFGAPCHVIIDFSLVEVMPSSTISELIIIENHLHERDRQLVLCSVPHRIQELLVRIGVQSLFRLADDQLGALQLLDRCSCPGR
jgi:anti-anti-sigma regulatory factor